MSLNCEKEQVSTASPMPIIFLYCINYYRLNVFGEVFFPIESNFNKGPKFIQFLCNFTTKETEVDPIIVELYDLLFVLVFCQTSKRSNFCVVRITLFIYFIKQ